MCFGIRWMIRLNSSQYESNVKGWLLQFFNLVWPFARFPVSGFGDYKLLDSILLYIILGNMAKVVMSWKVFRKLPFLLKYGCWCLLRSMRCAASVSNTIFWRHLCIRTYVFSIFYICIYVIHCKRVYQRSHQADFRSSHNTAAFTYYILIRLTIAVFANLIVLQIFDWNLPSLEITALK